MSPLISRSVAFRRCDAQQCGVLKQACSKGSWRHQACCPCVKPIRPNLPTTGNSFCHSHESPNIYPIFTLSLSARGVCLCSSIVVFSNEKGVDNLFVFLMTFDYFQVPLEHQGRVLTWGIVGAVLMRGVMIAFGVAVVTRFRWIMIVFAGILLVSSYKLLMEAEDEDHDLSQNTLVR